MKNQRFQFIDSSRGIAAFCVLLHHFICCYFTQPVADGFASNISFLWNGSSPVAYFFVLSGFILSTAYFNKQKSIHSLKFGHYIVQRLFRIYPLFLVCLFISYILNTYMHWHGHYPTLPPVTEYAANLWSSDKTLWQVLQEAILIKRIPLHANSRLLPQDWTLTLEIIMSLFIPVLILLLRRSFLWFAVVTLLIFQYDIYIMPFAAGVVLARFKDDLTASYLAFNAHQKVLLLLVATFFYFSGCNLYPIFSESSTVSLTMQTLGASLMLVIVLNATSVKKILSFRPLAFLGKVSFGLYLTHFFVLIFLVPYFIHFLNNKGVVNTHLVLSLAFLFLVIVSVGVSTLLYFLIEVPFIKLGKELTAVKKWKIGDPARIVFPRLSPIPQKSKD